MSCGAHDFDIEKGGLVLYRDGQAFCVGRADIVRESDVTLFPFDRSQKRYQRMRKRVPFSNVRGTLGAGVQPVAVAAKLNVLMNQHLAKRRSATAWLENEVGRLVEEMG